MTNLQTLNGCTCLVHYVYLSCPFTCLMCKDCEFNVMVWPSRFSKQFILNALNHSRKNPFPIVYNPIEYAD